MNYTSITIATISITVSVTIITAASASIIVGVTSLIAVTAMVFHITRLTHITIVYILYVIIFSAKSTIHITVSIIFVTVDMSIMHFMHSCTQHVS